MVFYVDAIHMISVEATQSLLNAGDDVQKLAALLVVFMPLLLAHTLPRGNHLSKTQC